MIARGSYPIILPFLVVSVLIAYYNWIISIPTIVFTLYLTYFFRDPKRDPPNDPTKILSAADGKIIHIDQTESELKIAVRMSPFDVHLNRSPITGKILEIIRRPGKHLSVYFADVEKKNEQNLIRIENETIRLEILQITGIFARRLVTWVESADFVEQGQKIGIIRFGSQTNVLIKSRNNNKHIKCQVKIGDMVKAGLSVLAIIEDRQE